MTGWKSLNQKWLGADVVVVLEVLLVVLVLLVLVLVDDVGLVLVGLVLGAVHPASSFISTTTTHNGLPDHFGQNIR